MSSEHYEQLGRATDAVQKAQKRSSTAQEHLLEFQAQMEAFRNVNFRMLRVEGGRLSQRTQAGRGQSVQTQEVGRWPTYDELMEAVEERDEASRALQAARAAFRGRQHRNSVRRPGEPKAGAMPGGVLVVKCSRSLALHR